MKTASYTTSTFPFSFCSMYESAFQSPAFFCRSSTSLSSSTSCFLSSAACATPSGVRKRTARVPRISLVLFMRLLSTEVGHGRDRAKPGGAHGGIDRRQRADQGQRDDGADDVAADHLQVQVIGHQE